MSQFSSTDSTSPEKYKNDCFDVDCNCSMPFVPTIFCWTAMLNNHFLKDIYSRSVDLQTINRDNFSQAANAYLFSFNGGIKQMKEKQYIWSTFGQLNQLLENN